MCVCGLLLDCFVCLCADFVRVFVAGYLLTGTTLCVEQALSADHCRMKHDREGDRNCSVVQDLVSFSRRSLRGVVPTRLAKKLPQRPAHQQGALRAPLLGGVVAFFLAKLISTTPRKERLVVCFVSLQRPFQ